MSIIMKPVEHFVMVVDGLPAGLERLKLRADRRLPGVALEAKDVATLSEAFRRLGTPAATYNRKLDGEPIVQVVLGTGEVAEIPIWGPRGFEVDVETRGYLLVSTAVPETEGQRIEDNLILGPWI